MLHHATYPHRWIFASACKYTLCNQCFRASKCKCKPCLPFPIRPPQLKGLKAKGLSLSLLSLSPTFARSISPSISCWKGNAPNTAVMRLILVERHVHRRTHTHVHRGETKTSDSSDSSFWLWCPNSNSYQGSSLSLSLCFPAQLLLLFSVCFSSFLFYLPIFTISLVLSYLFPPPPQLTWSHIGSLQLSFCLPVIVNLQKHKHSSLPFLWNSLRGETREGVSNRH